MNRPNKVLNVLLSSTGEYEKVREGDVVVEIGGAVMYRFLGVSYDYVHLVEKGPAANLVDNWVAVPIHKFADNWLVVEKGAGDWDDK